MNKLYLLTAVDARRVDEPNDSRANLISKLTIPGLTFVTASHSPGGGVMGVDFTMPRIEAPEPAFGSKGVDTSVFKGMGARSRWVFAGSYRDKMKKRDVPGRAIIEGAISAWEPDESDPSDFQGCNHVFKEVVHYEFHLDGKELFYVDFWERVLRVDGKDLWESTRNALGA